MKDGEEILVISEIMARQMAELVRNKCWNGDIPVNLEQIASELRERKEKPTFKRVCVMILEAPDEDMGDLSMMVRLRDGYRFEIVVRASEGAERKRLAKAFGIGCVILGHINKNTPMQMYSTFKLGRSKGEDAAVAFALELLMPTRFLEVGVKNLPNLSELSKEFGVSEVTMRIRLQDDGFDIPE